ncbi:REP-associated tyrosine transposase [Pseudomonas panipatensis]|jgi:REP element-mobilizing transposase RayT|uniref:REP-associated tyrosine transposase n=1 Tax=Pseudomonas panipatensis TaxID=428992 RepID=UPI0035B00914
MTMFGQNLQPQPLAEQRQVYLLTTVSADLVPRFRNWTTACLIAREIHRMGQELALESLAWVLMPDHLHWLLRLPAARLERSVHHFQARSARALMSLRADHGPAWQQGYHHRRLRDDEDCRGLARRMIAQPLRAGLVRRIVDYPFWYAAWL